MRPILVWDLPTRLFHWILAGGFLTAFAIAQFSDQHGALFPYHGMIGLLLGALVLLRILWGFIGTRYARFRSFLFPPTAIFAYLKGAASGQSARYVGHNPPSSYAIFLMLALVLVIATTGWLMGQGNDSVEDLHSIAAYTLLAVAGLHVLGVIVHVLRQRENIVASMFTGKKHADPALAIPSATPLWAAGLVLVLVLFGGSLYANYNPATRQTALPVLGTPIQLGEAEKDRPHSGDAGHRHKDHDDDHH